MGNEYKKKFNLEYAFIGFLTTGIVAFFTNLDLNMMVKSIMSGILQGSFSFITLGINTALFEYLYKKLKNKSFLIKITSIFLPAFLSGFASYIIHSLNNSMNPLLTAIGVFVLAVFTFTIMYLSIKKYNTIKLKRLIKIFFNI